MPGPELGAATAHAVAATLDVSIGTPLHWFSFSLFVAVMLALDLGVFHRRSHSVGFKEAAAWSVVWIALALAFNVLLYIEVAESHGDAVARIKATEFLTGWLVEKSLSVDNLFVFAVVFGYFGVPAVLHHTVLFWGILGALVMRAAFIFAGAQLLNAWHGVVYVFGGFLVYTGIRMMRADEGAVDLTKSPVVRLWRRFVPTVADYRGARFLVRDHGRTKATPLLMTLAVIEFTDLVFAVDSIPAIFAVTRDPFIVYTSNIFAILGLRAMYFLLAGVLDRFWALKPALSIVLVFVGIKMLVAETAWRIPSGVSLGVIAAVLVGAAVISAMFPRRAPEPHA